MIQRQINLRAFLSTKKTTGGNARPAAPCPQPRHQYDIKHISTFLTLVGATLSSSLRLTQMAIGCPTLASRRYKTNNSNFSRFFLKPKAIKEKCHTWEKREAATLESTSTADVCQEVVDFLQILSMVIDSLIKKQYLRWKELVSSVFGCLMLPPTVKNKIIE